MRYAGFFLIILLFACTPAKKDITISFAGDLLLDRGVRRQINASNPGYLFSGIKGILKSSDYAIANLECPITKYPSPLFKKYIFRGEPMWLPTIKNAGFTHLDMANNHSYDQGRDGIIATAYNLDSIGLIKLGYGKNSNEAAEPTIITKDGNRIAVFASVLLSLENWMYLPDKPGMCQATVNELCSNIRAYKAAHPKDIIVVCLHWGVELRQKPEPMQHQQAHALVEAGADLIIGHHPHVVQSIEIYKNRPIFYSIGNFVFDQTPEICNQAIMPQVTFSDGHISAIHIYPLHINKCRPQQMDNKENESFFKTVCGFSNNLKMRPGTPYWEIKL